MEKNQKGKSGRKPKQFPHVFVHDLLFDSREIDEHGYFRSWNLIPINLTEHLNVDICLSQ